VPCSFSLLDFARSELLPVFDSPCALPEVSSISGGFCFPFGFCAEAEAAAAARESPHRQPVVWPTLISFAYARHISRGWFFSRRSIRSSRSCVFKSASCWSLPKCLHGHSFFSVSCCYAPPARFISLVSSWRA
jgi:hypothetical protein